MYENVFERTKEEAKSCYVSNNLDPRKLNQLYKYGENSRKWQVIQIVMKANSVRSNFFEPSNAAWQAIFNRMTQSCNYYGHENKTDYCETKLTRTVGVFHV